VAKSSKVKPRLIRSVDILGHKVRINYVSKVLFDGEDELDGSYSNLVIHVSKDSDIHSTTLHEIFHAVFDISGVGKLVTPKVEEAIVTALENALKDYFILKRIANRKKRYKSSS